MFFKRLYRLLFSKEIIDVYLCNGCHKHRTSLEWEEFRQITCPVCGSNKVVTFYPTLIGRGKVWLRYLAKGY
jgi:DNA-directed RNA polymerase subunit RPC12/RpoP